MLAVSELATNGIAHSARGDGGMITVRVRAAPGWARVEVTDDGPGPGSPTRRNGWGLPIVAGVTDRSGATMWPDGHRTAWAEVTWVR
jgi:anti-sigma regulatory factor (Ser/Thr protein kinase)